MLSKLAAITLVSFTALGQTAAPAFEAASIKPATPLGALGMRADRNGGPDTADPGMYTCRNCPIEWVLSEAYDLQPFEFTGPEWLQNSRFDFIAKVPRGTGKPEFRTMLQSLLAERFQLKVHREPKAMLVYELTIGKNGSKLREAVPKDAAEEAGTPGPLLEDKDGFPILTGRTTMAVLPGHARIRGDNQPVSWLVRMLVGQLGGPVIDVTGLKARYNFLVSWAFKANNPSAATGDDALDEYRPALIQAVESQLGLKMERKKGRAEVLIIDHIERAPSAN